MGKSWRHIRKIWEHSHKWRIEWQNHQTTWVIFRGHVWLSLPEGTFSMSFLWVHSSLPLYIESMAKQYQLPGEFGWVALKLSLLSLGHSWTTYGRRNRRNYELSSFVWGRGKGIRPGKGIRVGEWATGQARQNWMVCPLVIEHSCGNHI